MPTTSMEMLFQSDLAAVRKMVQTCIQCGTCTASCPNQFAMDITPRRLWRLVLMNRTEAVFASKIFSLCSSCYYCTLRCPRGLPLTEAMDLLKQIAFKKKDAVCKASAVFYRNFMQSVRRHGRVREMEIMVLFLAQMKSPLLPFHFAPLGVKLMAKGKVPLQLPSHGSGKLNLLFETVAKMEKRS